MQERHRRLVSAVGRSGRNRSTATAGSVITHGTSNLTGARCKRSSQKRLASSTSSACGSGLLDQVRRRARRRRAEPGVRLGDPQLVGPLQEREEGVAVIDVRRRGDRPGWKLAGQQRRQRRGRRAGHRAVVPVPGRGVGQPGEVGVVPRIDLTLCRRGARRWAARPAPPSPRGAGRPRRPARPRWPQRRWAARWTTTGESRRNWSAKTGPAQARYRSHISVPRRAPIGDGPDHAAERHHDEYGRASTFRAPIPSSSSTSRPASPPRLT